MKNMTPFTDAVLSNALRRVEAWLRHKCSTLPYGALNDASDSASIGVVYALLPGLTGKGAYPATERDLVNMAAKKAWWTLLDSIKRALNSPIVASYDESFEDEEGNMVSGDAHPYVSAASIEAADVAQKEAAMLDLAGEMLEELPAHFDTLGVKHRDRQIYIEHKLNGSSSRAVAEQLNMSEDNVNTVSRRVNDLLKRTYRHSPCRR